MPRLFAAMFCLICLGLASAAPAGERPLSDLLSWTEQAWARLQSLDEDPDQVDRRASDPSNPYSLALAAPPSRKTRDQTPPLSLRIPTTFPGIALEF